MASDLMESKVTIQWSHTCLCNTSEWGVEVATRVKFNDFHENFTTIISACDLALWGSNRQYLDTPHDHILIYITINQDPLCHIDIYGYPLWLPPFSAIEVAPFQAIASICRCNIRPVAICKIHKRFMALRLSSQGLNGYWSIFKGLNDHSVGSIIVQYYLDIGRQYQLNIGWLKYMLKL
jgi:hypothetical protein